ncbi:DUF6520 family protein [Robertkochia solimangrovi]|uniref:DUF6520 family protein n=1 Tax=Robertkochia solimangrovi TaxID=2213046 RepID=UPI00117E27C4|nr:DUF6520 family protein [Robertkochia solimangrovi]TRZ46097.1 hypothetical protein DMZ48_02180 [Robertkochia solimangrovi]
MKNLKVLMSSSVLLLAVLAAFAGKNSATENMQEQYYKQEGSACIVTDCDPLNTGDICTFTVYEQKQNASTCNTPVVLSYRP